MQSDEPTNNIGGGADSDSSNSDSNNQRRQESDPAPTPTPRPDADGDGYIDSEDDFPTDPNYHSDTDGDRVPDSEDDFPNDPRYSSDSDGDQIPDPEDDLPNDPRYHSQTRKSGTVSIKEDHWRYWNIEMPSSYNRLSVTYEFMVRDGPNIDVYVMSADEFRFFENGDRAKYFTRWSSPDTGLASKEISLRDSGEYVLVADNSDWGSASPPTNFNDDIADVEYELTYRWS